ncbi:MAG: glycosyltransferase family 4 protein, partial [Candidatus Andersenbacteria bacterium]|nr:glycosyltransferase family 4 protein [Candidatus Andersenbacteria bacterium]
MNKKRSGKTHILFITRSFSPHAGGMERLSWEMINHISRSSEVNIKIISHQGGRFLGLLFPLLCLPRAITTAKQADVIHLGDPLLSLAGWLVKKIYHKPVIVTVHGLDITYPNPLYQAYLHLFFCRLSAYIAISSYTASLLPGIGVNKNITVINPGISDRYYNDQITRGQLTHFLGRDLTHKKIILTVGRLIKRKGQAWFIANVLSRLDHNYLYVIAGTGPEEHNIRQAAANGKLTDRVILLGRVSNEQLAILYNTADVFVAPNIKIPSNVEGFGLVLAEAALCRRPVFAANLEGMTDAITSGVNGLLIESSNASQWIQVLTRHFSSINQFPQIREFTLRKFNWQQKINDYLSVIK